MRTHSRFLAQACALLLVATLASTASAQSFSGHGGTIPDNTGGTWPTTLPTGFMLSTVNVTVPVADVVSVALDGFDHTWLGDVHVILETPAGVRHNVMHRPGFTGTGFGNSGDPGGSPHIFVETGGLSVPVMGDMPADTYNQSFGVWPGGLVLNTPMTTISGTAGTWSLYIYDWAGADVGLITGWTLTVNSGAPQPPTIYCTAKITSSGCVPSIAYAGTPSPAGGFVASCTQVEAGQLGVLFHATAGPAAIPFQGGLLCVNPPVVRLPIQPSGGAAACSGTYSQALTTLITTLGPGVSVCSQFWFRDPGDAFGTGLSNGLAFVTQ